MTDHRRPRIPYSDAPQGVCRWCGEEIRIDHGEKKGSVNRRRRWHQACVDIYNASDPREARRRIRRRDRGRCAICRVDTYRIRRELKKIRRGRAQATRERGYKPRQSFWELDHVVPLIDGGSHDDDNLQTLCTPCHTRKTADEARVRAQRNRSTDDAAAGESECEAIAKTADAESNPVVGTPTRSTAANADDTLPKNTRPTASLDALFAAADSVNARVAEFLEKAIPR